MILLAHILMPDALVVFFACAAFVAALALHFSGERCSECGKRGPFVGFGMKGLVCHRCG